MGYIIAGIIIIAILYWIVVYIIVPVAPFVGGAVLLAAMLYALVISVRSFFGALTEYINPYATYVDSHKDAPAGIRRNYFFGPGYHQLWNVVKLAFVNLGGQIGVLTAWVKGKRQLKWVWKVFLYAFYGLAVASAAVFGFGWVAAFSTLMIGVILPGMCLFYLTFSILWLSDRVALFSKSIHSRCPDCKGKILIPAFVCPECGTVYDKLTPGPYGVFHRKCPCGEKLPSTFLNGRSRISSQCPFCAAELAASDASQFGIQLVGGVSAGKTTFLSAFWHLYFERIKKNVGVVCDKAPDYAFEELEQWYQTGRSAATTEMNANMYSVVHRNLLGTPYQFSVYDIAGEVFQDSDYTSQQQQYRYCDGFVFILDPTAPVETAGVVFERFMQVYAALNGMSAKRMSAIPVAVVLSKADLHKREIGYVKIKSIYDKNPAAYEDLDAARDAVCRSFLVAQGYGNTVNHIDASFQHVRFFPISAIGHDAQEGETYQPWGVEEPVRWILKHREAPNQMLYESGPEKASA